MGYRVELAKSAEADLESLNLWVYCIFFTVDEKPRVVRVVHIRRGARR